MQTTGMTRQDTAQLFLIGAIFGMAFLFVRVAVPQFGAIPLIELRVVPAGAVLLVLVLALRLKINLRRDWLPLVGLSIFSAVVPFTLIAFAEVHLTASLAAILNATTPIWGMIFVAMRIRAMPTAKAIVGAVIAFLGVVLMAGLGPIAVNPALIVSTGLMLVAAASYAVGALLARARLSQTPGLVQGAAQCVIAGLVLLIPAVIARPATMPDTRAIWCGLALSLLCTAFAFSLLFRLNTRVGPSRALTVTFLAPLFGVFWGVIFLHEPFTVGLAIGLVVILAGVALITGLNPLAFLPRRGAATVRR